jgi:hypothetical protein
MDVIGSGPQITSVYMRQVRDSSGYVVTTDATGAARTFAAGQSELTLSGGAITSITVNLTASPVDGQNNCIFTQGGITTLTLAATSPATINNTVTTMSAATRVCFEYNLANTAWDRTL